MEKLCGAARLPCLPAVMSQAVHTPARAGHTARLTEDTNSLRNTNCKLYVKARFLVQCEVQKTVAGCMWVQLGGAYSKALC